MKKVLLTLFAVVAAISSYAQYQVGDYILSDQGRFKVTGVADIEQPSLGSTVWQNVTALYDSYVADAADEAAGIDFSGIMANKENAESTDSIFAAFPLTYGTNYILTFRFKQGAGGTAAQSSLTSTDVNYIDAWVAKADFQGVKSGTAGTDYMQVATTFSLLADEWKEVSWNFTDTIQDASGNSFLNIRFGRIETESVIASNMQLVSVVQTYDTRVIERRIAYVEQLMKDANFAVAEAEDAKAELEGIIIAIKEGIPAGEFDDEADATDAVNNLESYIEDFLGVTSGDLESILKCNTTNAGNKGRGSLTSYGNTVTLTGGNWGKIADDNGAIRSAIQNSYENKNNIVDVNNSYLPAGKYFFSGEIRNANSGKDSWPCVPTYNLTTDCTISLGDAEKTVTISGEEYTSFYIVGTVPEGSQFSAKITWPGPDKGGIFNVRNLVVRTFDYQAAVDTVQRKTDFATFKAQWDAAQGRLATINERLGDKLADYPYAVDTLRNALAKWTPYLDEITGLGWIDADGNDTGVATNEELVDWAKRQGKTDEEGYDEETNTTWYQVVRGLDAAIKTSTEMNSFIPAFEAVIAAAKATLADEMYQFGDKETFSEAIGDAESVLSDIKLDPVDDTYDADTLAVSNATKTLNEAIEAFKQSADGTLKPFIDIDFSTGWTQTDEGYAIKGKDDMGEMTFTSATVQTNNATAETKFSLGFEGTNEEVLRIGNGDGTIAFDAPTDDEVLRVTFDVWLGKLTKRFFRVQLCNEEGSRIAGFNIDCYNVKSDYNDFNDADNTGMNILSYATGIGSSSQTNNAIYAANNKTSVDLVIDYKANTVKGIVENPQKGKCEGAVMPLTKAYDDNKIVKLLIGSSYSSNPERRCWFDNVKIYKYPSSATGEDPVSINSVANTTSNAAAGIYTISGAKVNGLQKGINIVKMQNGQVKKVFVK